MLKRKILQEMEMAGKTVYRLFPATPLEPLDLQSDCTVWIKREDLSPIHSYKWRGAFYKLAKMAPEILMRGVVTASAGNHAQGVSAAIRHLGGHAIIFMPETTPLVKISAVRNWGKDQIRILLKGGNFQESLDLAKRFAQENQYPLIHPYDDLEVMAGQGTLAREVSQCCPPLEVAFLQIGGGGMAGAVAIGLKKTFPRIQIIGVEAQGQASMSAAFKEGGPVDLPEIDSFCDGTSVQRVGENCYPLCKTLLDDLITVSNVEVCHAIKRIWEVKRFIPEPSGALGIAGFIQKHKDLKGKKILAIVTGANLDFTQIGRISQSIVEKNQRKKFFSGDSHFLKRGEENGNLL